MPGPRSAAGRYRLRFVGQQPKESGHRESESRSIVGLRRIVASGRIANDDQRHAQAERVVGVVQAVDLVIGSELDAAEIVVVPQPVANRDRDVPLLASHFDRFVAAGMEQSSGAGNSQRGFERGVVDIAGAAELGIVRIAPMRESGPIR